MTNIDRDIELAIAKQNMSYLAWCLKDVFVMLGIVAFVWSVSGLVFM